MPRWLLWQKCHAHKSNPYQGAFRRTDFIACGNVRRASSTLRPQRNGRAYVLAEVKYSGPGGPQAATPGAHFADENQKLHGLQPVLPMHCLVGLRERKGWRRMLE